MNESLEIPTSWLKTELGEVLDYGKSEKAEPGEIPLDAWVLELEDIEKNTSRLLERITFAQRQPKSTKNRFLKGDVLYSRLRPYLNKVLIADQDGYCTTEIIPLRPNDAIYGPFLFYWLKHPEFLKYAEAVSYGINMPRLGTKVGLQAPLILAPYSEQKRIADKLDSLLVRLDTCQTRLERVRLILDRYRQSVLVAATSGMLTEAWREDEEVLTPWQTVRLPDVASARLGKMLDKAKNQGSPTPYLRNANVRWFEFDLTDIQTIRVTEDEKDIFSVRQGDIFICEGGSYPGRCAVWYGPNDEYVFQKALHRVRVGEDLIPEWLCYCLKVAADSGRLEEFFTGTTIKHLTGIALDHFGFELPSYTEQQEIVRRVEKLFDLADRVEARYQAAQIQVEQLAPMLLSKAFRGELIPQDPNDEPASVLLERIREARASAATQIKKTSRRSAMQKKSTERRRLSKPIDVVQALHEAGKELSGDDLFIAAGYPSDADSELIEAYFVDIRDALQENKISRVRRGNMDWFSLV